MNRYDCFLFRILNHYDNLWSRRIVGSRGVNPKGEKWSVGQELTTLQGRVTELDLTLEVNSCTLLQ